MSICSLSTVWFPLNLNTNTHQLQKDRECILSRVSTDGLYQTYSRRLSFKVSLLSSATRISRKLSLVLCLSCRSSQSNPEEKVNVVAVLKTLVLLYIITRQPICLSLFSDKRTFTYDDFLIRFDRCTDRMQSSLVWESHAAHLHGLS